MPFLAIEMGDLPMKNGWIFPWPSVSLPEAKPRILRLSPSFTIHFECQVPAVVSSMVTPLPFP